MEASGNNKIHWEVRDGLGYLTFADEPENRMDSAFFMALQHLTHRVMPGAKFSAIIVSGSGRHFSSGANLDELLQHIAHTKKENRAGALLTNNRTFQYFASQNVPVIAAIRGVCLGSALELALHCHFRLCSTDAVFGLPESGFGLMPGIGGIPKLMALAGKAKAMEWVLRGNTIGVHDALNHKVVDAVFNKKELTAVAESLALIAAKNYRKYNKADYLRQMKISLKHVEG